VGAYLISNGIARSADEAMDALRRARPSIVIRPEVRAALTAFAGTAGAPPPSGTGSG
jgi:hypothetical protein